jgi:hypothetical protein
MHEVDKVDPVKVSVNIGFKRNMGNYESMNINVGLTASAMSGESAQEAFDRVYTFAEERLMEKFQETEEALKEAGLGEK